MRDLYIILDTSGSIDVGGVHKIAQVNDLIRELLACVEGESAATNLIIYSDIPRIYWESRSKEIFRDIPENEFDGRSNLGKAYTFVKDMIVYNSKSLKDVCLVLISDGQATDNYLVHLLELDPKKESTRVAGALSVYRDTLEAHVAGIGEIFTDLTSVNGRTDFIEAILEQLKK